MSSETIHAVVYKDADSDQWVAQCLEYDVATQGDSEEHAKAMIREAVELYLEDMTADRLERVRQPIEGYPVIAEIAIDAPSLLKR